MMEEEEEIKIEGSSARRVDEVRGERTGASKYWNLFKFTKWFDGKSSPP